MFRRLLRPSLFQSLKRPTRRGPVLTTLSLSFGGGALALNAAASSSNEHQPPLSSLLRGYLVFSLCSLPSLVDASPRIISFLSSVPVLRQVSDAFLKVTFFDQFVGAETVDECIPLLHSLRKSNQGALFSYSVEQPSSPSLDPSQQALQSILHSIDIAANFEDSLPNSTTSSTWVAVKLSTLLPDPSSLRLLSSAIISHQEQQQQPSQIPFPHAPDPLHIPLIQHFQSLKSLLSNLHTICSHAQSRNIKLTIDAEESWFQPAIDLFSLLLMQEFNHNHNKEGPIIYTTIQAYLKRTPTFLNYLINHSKSNNYSLGIKLVRGAYIDAEISAAAASASSSPPPTFPDKPSTDKAYDDSVRILIHEIANSTSTSSKNGLAVLFGTHNWKSSNLILDQIIHHNLGKELEDNKKIILSEQAQNRIAIAQLYGMSDSLSDYLVDRTSSSSSDSSPFVIRYVPYGPLRDVMPYLARRAVENKSVLGEDGGGDSMSHDLEGGGAVVERKRMKRLIWERVRALIF